MATQVLKDRYGCIIGKFETASNGVQTIKDKYGYIKGSYDPKMNKTKDKYGYVVGTGNLLATLI